MQPVGAYLGRPLKVHAEMCVITVTRWN